MLITLHENCTTPCIASATCIYACCHQHLDEIYQEIDNGGACGVLFLDLAKALDTVDYNVLIEKV